MKTFTFFKNYLCWCKKSLCILQITHLLLSPLCTLFIIYSLSTELPENPSWKTSCRKQVLWMNRLCKKMYLFNAFSERRENTNVKLSQLRKQILFPSLGSIECILSLRLLLSLSSSCLFLQLLFRTKRKISSICCQVSRSKGLWS